MRTPPVATILLFSFLASCQNAGTMTGQNTLDEELIANATDTAQSDADAEASEDKIIDPVSTAAIEKKTALGQVEKLFFEYKAPPKGARFTWRSNWASMPPLVVYEVQGLVMRGGTEYVSLKSVKGLAETTYAFYDTENFSLKGYRDGDDEALTTFKPVEQRYSFPLEKGKQWISKWKMMDHKTGKVTSGGGVFQVVALELLKLPAGNFQTAKIKLPVAPGLPRGMTHYVWFAPKLGITVREQIGNGQMNWTQVLEKVELPGAS
jgi:hypothetical protein